MTALVRNNCSTLLSGCCHEAERARLVGNSLEGLRNALPDNLHTHLNLLIQEVHLSSQFLRRLADQAQIHGARVPQVLEFINVLLPCLSRSLRDITGFVDDRSHSKETRWRTMYHTMTKELPGTPLPARFNMYNMFLFMLIQLLEMSPEFDLNALYSLHDRITQLREARGIPPPSPVQSDFADSVEYGMITCYRDINSHWAQAVFARIPTTHTELPKSHRMSQAYGPFRPIGLLSMPHDAKTLAMRSFNDNQLSVTFYLHGSEEIPWVMIRDLKGGQPWVTRRGAHELCIQREAPSSLVFSRWSRSESRIKLFASLSFATYEDMVLFYCTFVVLKARSPEVVKVRQEEYKIKKEKLLFKAPIKDDDFVHGLAVYHDSVTSRLRLHATVWDGELMNCPVWTAFLPADGPSNTWMRQKTYHRVWINNVDPYVFCGEYKSRHQRKGKTGAFELEFLSATAAKAFQQIFSCFSSVVETNNSASSFDPGLSVIGKE